MTGPARARLLLTIGIGAMVVAVLVGPFVSHPGFSSVRHSTSELAGQNMPNAWITRAGFVLYGLSVAVPGTCLLRPRPALGLCCLVFGIGLVGTAIWSASLIDMSLGFDRREDVLHSVFSGVVGAAFACACLLDIIENRPGVRALSWVGLVASVALPMAMFNLPAAAGLFQRLMFAISFVWFWRRLGPRTG